MSRYTEIEQQAHYAYERRICEHDQEFADGIKIGFKEGAKWADKTMIDKACDWMKSIVPYYGIVLCTYESSEPCECCGDVIDTYTMEI